MTKEDWKVVEDKLKHIMDVVELQCDEYKVSLVLKRENQFKNSIMVYVNGVFKYEWMNKDCEESRRFLRKVTKSLYSQKRKQAYNKLPKRIQKELKTDINKVFIYYMPTWTSFNSLKRNLIKENNNIKLRSQSSE